VARRLLPSDTVALSRRSTAGAVLEFGGEASHAAILTREIGIPAVSGIQNVATEIPLGTFLVVDGFSGFVTVEPTEQAKTDFHNRMEEKAVEDGRLEVQAQEKAITSRGTVVTVAANIGCREDAVAAAQKGADAIGLYRIEHIYLKHPSLPSEDELYAAVVRAIEPMKGKSVTIRLLDAGADKQLPFVSLADEDNPSLGQRGVRLLRRHPDLARTQLRTIVRLSRDHDVRILVPMVTVAEDIVVIREQLRVCAADVGTRPLPPLGAMIETPAAALCTSAIAAAADFLSVGSNDLTQYTMAAGRENPLVSNYFVDDHPAVLQLLKSTVNNAGELPVAICGELASDARVTKMLVETGFRQLSVAPRAVPRVKGAIRGLSL
jgi:phosphotransferase system enzyme I (PtsI)